MKQVIEPNILEIAGHRVNLDKIQNPALKRVIGQRMKWGEFLFAYGDHDEYNEKHKDYKDHREKYQEWKEHKYEDYRDYNVWDEWHDV